MNPFVLMTDSCCDLPANVAEKLALDVQPLSVHIGHESFANYLDGRELPSTELYARIRAGAMPSTSAVNVGMFEEAMRAHLEAGEDVLCIAFSGALSATCQSAMIAAKDLCKEFPERTIAVHDSCCASLGQGLLVMLCAQKKAAGATLEEVLDYAKTTAPKIHHWFSVEDLNHLKRGGRISAAAAALGSMLSIKPILKVSATGTLESVSKERGHKAAMNNLVKKAVDLGDDIAAHTVIIGHADCPQDAEYLAQQLAEKTGIEKEHILIQCFGAVIGSHIGPGTAGVFFLGRDAR